MTTLLVGQDFLAGLVFPQSVLSSTWFLLMATVVAFNTIVYLGLTLSKLIPWPRQFHPSKIRGWLQTIGVSPDDGTDQLPANHPSDPPADDAYEILRRSLTRRNIPLAFGLLGIFVIIVSFANTITLHDQFFNYALIHMAAGLLFILLAIIFARRPIRTRWMTITWTLSSVYLVISLLVESSLIQDSVPLSYAMIVMVAFPPISLAWRPTFIGGAVMVTSLVIAAIIVPDDETIVLVIAGLAALTTGYLLLYLRTVSIVQLAIEREQVLSLSTTDELTGLLTRHGLLSIAHTLAGTAERTQKPVCVLFFDIDNLNQANVEYGQRYGDDVIKTVGQAIEQRVRQGDLVSRWGEDDFVVLGIGGKPDAEALAQRIQSAITASGVNLGKWPTTVSVGTASGDVTDTTFDQLLEIAAHEARREHLRHEELDTTHVSSADKQSET